MKNVKLIALLVVMYGAVQAQNDPPKYKRQTYTFLNSQVGDTSEYRARATAILKKLKGGSVIVRLKTNRKSIEAHRNAGEEKVAQRMEKQVAEQNQKLYAAFTSYFNFCKVHFIYAEDTKDCLKGKHVFLNKNLAYEPKIALHDTNFVFCEYGSAESYSKYTDVSGFAVDEPSTSATAYDIQDTHKVRDTMMRQTSTDPASTSCLYFLDRKGRQLFRPFPAPEPVNVNNYGEAVTNLNLEMDKAYYDLVVRKKDD